MGSAPSKITYCVPVTKAKKGETPVFRHPDFQQELRSIPSNGVQNMQELFIQKFKEFPDNDFLGYRPRIENKPGQLEEYYEWLKWSEIETICNALGSALHAKDMVPSKKQFRDLSLRFAAIYAGNSREWILIDIACNLYGITFVPIYDTLGEEAAEHMFNQTELTTCFLTSNHLDTLMKRFEGGTIPHLKNIVVMDDWKITQEALDRASKRNNLTVYYMTDLIEFGVSNPRPYPKVQPDDICLLSYTSGTTGVPKGAMISHRNLTTILAGTESHIPINKPVHLSYLPLAHIYERNMFIWTTLKNGKYGMFNGDVQKLKDDLAILKPNIFPSVPRLFNKFYDKIQSTVKSSSGCSGTILSRAIKVKS